MGEQPALLAGPGDSRTVVEHLRRRGLLDHDEVAVRALSGGVSADVLAVRGRGVDLVVKRPLHRLRVSEEWIADQQRALIEARALRTAARITPAHVPPVLDVDEKTYTIVIGHAETDAHEWRTDLLAGRIDISVASQLGDILARWHVATTDDAAIAEEFGDLATFTELRVEPFYHRVAKVHPDLAGHIGAVVERMLATRSCLVHGDFSPKNVLVDSSSVWVIDWEVAHHGDPHFDLALLMTHLACKSLHLPTCAIQFGSAARTFLDHYRAAAPQLSGVIDERYLLDQIGCLLLARIDGPSPTSYLDELARRRGRAVARAALTAQYGSLDDLWGALR
jgi:5-methylthioribose kinase